MSVMARTASDKSSRLAIALDPDRLGLLAGAAAATLVLGIGLFYRHADLLSALLRAGLVFVVSYAAAFVLVLVVKRVALTEVALRKEEERQKGPEATSGNNE